MVRWLLNGGWFEKVKLILFYLSCEFMMHLTRTISLITTVSTILLLLFLDKNSTILFFSYIFRSCWSGGLWLIYIVYVALFGFHRIWLIVMHIESIHYETWMSLRRLMRTLFMNPWNGLFLGAIPWQFSCCNWM